MDEEAARFYRRFGFEPSPLRDIEKLMLQLNIYKKELP